MTTFRWTESRESRRMTTEPPTQTNAFTAAGTSDNAYVQAYAAAATPSIVSVTAGTLYRQDISIDPVGFELWKVTVPYGTRKRENNSYRLSFDTTGGTVHIAASRETLRSYPEAFAPNHKQLIGVNGDDVAGADIVIPALRLTVNYKHPAGEMTIAKIKYLANITGTVNDGEFLTFDGGEVLFLGASGSEGTDAEVETSYSFACSANEANLTIGDMAGIIKRGHELAWIKYWDNTNATDGGTLPVKEPKYVYVERVYEEMDLALALGFG